jgi:hypothetical protein
MGVQKSKKGVKFTKFSLKQKIFIKTILYRFKQKTPPVFILY